MIQHKRRRGERGVLFSVPAVPEFKFPGICGIAFPKRELRKCCRLRAAHGLPELGPLFQIAALVIAVIEWSNQHESILISNGNLVLSLSPISIPVVTARSLEWESH